MRGPWQFEEPLCAEVGGEFWFPDKEDNLDISASFAKSICHKCTHKDECLEWALGNEKFGIWGGTNEKTRQRIRSKRGIKVA